MVGQYILAIQTSAMLQQNQARNLLPLKYEMQTFFLIPFGLTITISCFVDNQTFIWKFPHRIRVLDPSGQKTHQYIFAVLNKHT